MILGQTQFTCGSFSSTPVILIDFCGWVFEKTEDICFALAVMTRVSPVVKSDCRTHNVFEASVINEATEHLCLTSVGVTFFVS